MRLERLKAIVGERGWVSDPQALEPHLREWRGTWQGRTPLMLCPATTAEVADIVAECAAQGIAIVPQGGNTGLCGGAIPDRSGRQVLVSLRRMNRLRSISAENYSLVAEAGCILADLQRAAADVGRLFPLSLAAEGSCQIGGNLSTNAGGINVLRYGTAREQVLGLEVVLPDGRVIHGLRELRKDTAGYDIKQLFLGAEGTLGIITAAALRLFPPVSRVGTAFVAAASPQQAVSLLALLRERLHDELLAFELISARSLRMVLRHIDGVRMPLDTEAGWYVLLDVAVEDGGADFERELAQALQRAVALDVAIAKNEAERAALWRIRHSISEAQKFEGASLKHDVSVPVAAVGEFIDTATAAIAAHCDAARVVAFGHVGDGNVHFNVSQPPGWSAERFLAEQDAIAEIVYDAVARFDGSFSAEHGVGVLKKAALEKYRGGVEIELMRALKGLLDPRGIMNPGKVL